MADEQNVNETNEAPQVAVPPALSDVDPAKLAALKAKLAAFIGGKQAEASEPQTEEAVAAQQEAEQQEMQGGAVQQQVLRGADVDWSFYDLDFSVRHLYPKALFRQVGDQMQWVVEITEFYSCARKAGDHDRLVNRPGTKDGSSKEPVNLGEFLTGMVNGPEGWKIAAVLPGSGGDVNVLVQRIVNHVLPNPARIPTVADTENEVAVPTDEEIERAEAAGLNFAAELGLEAPAILEQLELELEVAPEGTPVFVKTREIPAALVGLQERANLDLNAATTERSVGRQPEALDADGLPGGLGAIRRGEDGQVERVIAPGIENVRRGLDNLLDGPDFGTV